MGLKDGEDVQLDRGDEVTLKDGSPPTEEERKLAEELKAKETADAEAAKAAEAEAAKKAKAKEDGEGEDDDEGDEGKGRKDTRIPLSRHKEILERERADKEKALARLAQFEGAKDLAKTNEEIQKAENKLIEMEGQHAKLLTDGKVEDAAKLMGDIRKLEREINRKHGALETAAAESRAYERARYDTTVERVEAAYPILNPDDEDNYDPIKVRKVLTIAGAYQQGGMTPSAALQEAVKDLLGDPSTKKQKEAVDVTPRVDEAAKKKAAREEEARRKAAGAAGSQPAKTDVTGKDSDTLGGKGLDGADVMKMTYEDFSKLDEKTLATMRGDIVA